VVVEAAARIVESVVRHELDDLERAVIAREIVGQRDLDGLRPAEGRVVKELAVGEHGKDGRIHDRRLATRRRPGGDGRLVG
jgi:hypothetical protein